ncbi:MAG: TonB-dependent receptor, partial [Bacteroidetes bacterium]
MNPIHILRPCLPFFLALALSSTLFGQSKVRGEVYDALTKDPLFGATVLVVESSEGTVTDFDGFFEIETSTPPPYTLRISYVGYLDKELQVTSADAELKIELEEDVVTIEAGVEVKGQRISEKQKAAPLTVESLDILAIKETPSDNFYDGLGSLKGVDLTAASLGFKIINTRGFNSTSPVRSLQLIDGVDNQSPGLNFSLGNFLGSSELDVLRVDLIQGASSAYYGPNAFNGVISMTTKDPFLQKGLAVLLKGGERNLFEGAIRWADALQNKDGLDWFAYKLNFAYLRADDWEAENYDPVDGSRVDKTNPGRWDAVNIYGDEYFSLNDFSDEAVNLPTNRAGLGIFYRTGYKEVDLVDYDTRNIKANAAFHFRLNPAKGFESPELIVASSFGSGTTVYQGDNRFSLRDILFFQNRIELRQKDKFFIRAYATNEDAGNSFDPYFTALRLQELAKSNEDWSKDYVKFWKRDIFPKMLALEYPTPSVDPNTGQLIFDFDGARAWLQQYNDSLTIWHSQIEALANEANVLI